VALNRTNLAILAEGGAAAALHRDGLAPGRLMVVGAGSASTAITGIGAGAIARVVRSAALVGVRSATIAGVVGTAPGIRSRLSSVVGVSAAATILRARLPGPVVGRSAWTAVLGTRLRMIGVGSAGASILATRSAWSLTGIAAWSLTRTATRMLCRSGMLGWGGMRCRSGMGRSGSFGRCAGHGGRRNYCAYAEYD
jgi:hypothetical protein